MKRYTFTGTLELIGSLHVGSGGGGRLIESESQTDATLVRDSRGRPYIPGSSLRGVLRAAIGQFAPAVFGDRAAVTIRQDEQLPDRRQIDEAVLEAQERAGAELFDAEAELQNQLTALLSPAERLFGTVYWSSPLFIPDLHLVERTRGVAGEIRHGVGIDRDTGAAREAIKYDFEVLPAGACFQFLMRCDIPEQPAAYELTWTRLLALGLRLLEQGELTLGGRLARGVGQVQLRDLTVYVLNTDERHALLDALLADGSVRYGRQLPANWTTTVLREAR